MPQELRQVNGRWVVTGAQQSSDLVPAVRPRPATRPTPAAKPKGKPPQRPWWSKLLNDVQYELTGRPRDAGRKALRDARTTPGGLAGVLAADTVLGVGGGAPRQFALGTVGATANAVRMAYSVNQRAPRWLGGQAKPKADANSGAFGSGINQAVEGAYRLLKAKPPSQMSQDERNIDQLRSSVALNLLLAPLTPGLGAATATTALGMGVRGGMAFAINEVMSTALDDNTGGNPANLVNMIPGVNLPLAVNVGQDDMVDAALKSALPNATASLGVGVAAGAAVTGFRNIRRNIRARRAVQQETKHRARQEAMGVTQVDEADGADFTPAVKQPPEPTPPPREPTFAEANAAMEERLGMRQPAEPDPAAAPAAAAEPKPIPSIEGATTENFGNARDATTQPLPEGDLDEDVWGGVYDPSLPESTTISKVWEELSDTEINTVMSNPGTPVIERLNQVLEARQGLDTPPPLDAGMVMAPTDKLAEDYLDAAVGKLQGREVWQLRPLFDPDTNPALWQRAQALSGVDEPGQLTKADMVETLQAQAAEGGQIPIVNRMMGAQMLPTAEITPAPQVFQYKGGVNEAGEQIGNSLSGVERWDPNAEGIIQVWRDANGEIGQPGTTYVVNGHNRLAAAQRMGIPSMRVEFLDAPTAAEARLQGAVSNVSDGKGTVFDAAKLAREYGITDPAQLKALGKPGASGFWKEGIAMGRLPEDVFTAAVNEQIPLRRAVIIGESGGDEETMRSAYRYLVQQGPENVKEGTLREMLAMAQHSPAASSTDQPDILTGTEWAQNFNQGMLAKADLASAVRLMLSKEKKLFGTVGRQAGQIERVGQVDATAAKGISGEASRALALFDQLKYQTGPVGDLLNEGTQRILAGESAAQVAKGIKNRLAASIAEAMGKEVGPVTDVVQEDMFAAAGRQMDEAPPPEPIELTQAERDAAEAQILHEAIAGGEVRPYNSPLPELPEPAQVRLDELTDEPLTPGSKQAQAVADEIRLAVEHKQADAALQFEQQQALRDATDYEGLSFDEKKDMGLTAGVDAPAAAARPEPLPLPPPTSKAGKDLAKEIQGLENRLDNVVKVRLPAAKARLDKLNAEPGMGGVNTARQEELVEQLERQEAALRKQLSDVLGRYGLDSPADGGGFGRASEPTAKISLTPLQKAEIENFNTTIMREMGIDLDGPMTRKQLETLERNIRTDFASPEQGGIDETVGASRRSMIGVADRMRKAINEMGATPSLAPAPTRPEPLQLTAPANQPELLLPRDLNKSTPRYGTNTVTFQSDLDRAAYVLANDAVKPSKAAGKFRQVVKEAGLNLDEVVAHGKQVKAALKQAAKGNPGQIELPAQPWRSGAPMASPQLFDDLENPATGPSLERLLFGGAPPAEREQILQRLGNKRLEGVWTLGQEGATDRMEKDILEFVQRMTGGRMPGSRVDADIADAVFVRTNNAGYGGGGIPKPEQVGGVNADHIYNENGAVLLISRYDNLLSRQGLAEMAQTGAHEAIHFLQARRLTQKQLEVLSSDEAVTYFRAEAGKALKWGGVNDLANIELMAWGSQRIIAARLLRDMESLYRKQGLKQTAAYVKEIRSTRLGEYVSPPTRIEKALEPLIELWERIKNYLLGAGFKRNIELTTEQLEIIARFTDAVAGPQIGFKGLAKAIDPRPSVAAEAAMPPKEVQELLDAAYTGQIGKQMYLRPGRMSDKAFANYERRWDVLGVSPSDYDASTLPPAQAGVQRVRQQIDSNNQRIDEIRRKAQQEGC